MKQARFAEEQIIGLLREAEAGAKPTAREKIAAWAHDYSAGRPLRCSDTPPRRPSQLP